MQYSEDSEKTLIHVLSHMGALILSTAQTQQRDVHIFIQETHIANII